MGQAGMARIARDCWNKLAAAGREPAAPRVAIDSYERGLSMLSYRRRDKHGAPHGF